MSHSTCSKLNSTETLLAAKSYADKVKIAIKSLFSTSAHASFANLATLSDSLENYFLKHSTKTLLWGMSDL